MWSDKKVFREFKMPILSSAHNDTNKLRNVHQAKEGYLVFTQ